MWQNRVCYCLTLSGSISHCVAVRSHYFERVDVVVVVVDELFPSVAVTMLMHSGMDRLAPLFSLSFGTQHIWKYHRQKLSTECPWNCQLLWSTGRSPLPAYFTSLIGFECLLLWFTEHFALFDYRQPERVYLIVVVASTVSVTFDDWCGTEFFETWSRWNEILTESTTVVVGRLKWTNETCSNHGAFKILSIFIDLPWHNCNRSTFPPIRLGNLVCSYSGCELQ